MIELEKSLARIIKTYLRVLALWIWKLSFICCTNKQITDKRRTPNFTLLEFTRETVIFHPKTPESKSLFLTISVTVWFIPDSKLLFCKVRIVFSSWNEYSSLDRKIFYNIYHTWINYALLGEWKILSTNKMYMLAKCSFFFIFSQR